MEIFVAFIIASLVAGRVGSDLLTYAKGKTPPRYALAQKTLDLMAARAAAKGDKVVKPSRRRAALAYFAALWGDTWDEAKDRHDRRLKKRRDRRAAIAAGEINPGAAHRYFEARKAELWEWWDKAWEKADRKRTEKRAAKQRQAEERDKVRQTYTIPNIPDAGGSEPKQDAPTEQPKSRGGDGATHDDLWCEAYDLGLKASGRDDFAMWFAHKYAARFDGQRNPPPARACAGEYWQAWKAERAKEKANRQPSKPSAPATTAKPEGNSNVSNGNPVGEVTGLSSAVDFTGSMSASLSEAMTQTDNVMASLEGQQVTGEIPAALAQAQENLQAAAAAYQTAAAGLASHMQVKDAYAATGNQAGSKEFVTGE